VLAREESRQAIDAASAAFAELNGERAEVVWERCGYSFRGTMEQLRSQAERDAFAAWDKCQNRGFYDVRMRALAAEVFACGEMEPGADYVWISPRLWEFIHGIDRPRRPGALQAILDGVSRTYHDVRFIDARRVRQIQSARREHAVPPAPATESDQATLEPAPAKTVSATPKEVAETNRQEWEEPLQDLISRLQKADARVPRADFLAAARDALPGCRDADARKLYATHVQSAGVALSSNRPRRRDQAKIPRGREVITAWSASLNQK
jgi:hypothetical protein